MCTKHAMGTEHLMQQDRHDSRPHPQLQIMLCKRRTCEAEGVLEFFAIARAARLVRGPRTALGQRLAQPKVRDLHDTAGVQQHAGVREHV